MSESRERMGRGERRIKKGYVQTLDVHGKDMKKHRRKEMDETKQNRKKSNQKVINKNEKYGVAQRT
jgi:hypothetical protein